MQITGKGEVTTLGLFFITIAAIASPIGLVIMSQYGFQSIFYYALIIILFFIPSALVCTEMGATWPEEGGYYQWMKQIFGGHLANILLWLQWLGILISFPVILAYVSNLLAYGLNMQSTLADNGVFIYCIALVITVFAVVVSLLGIKMTFWISAVASLFGSIIPSFLIIIFAAIWLWMGHEPQISSQGYNLIPEFKSFSQFSFLGPAVFMFAGMEIAAYYMKFVNNARKKYPIALTSAAFVLIIMSVLGTLAITVLVPSDTRSIVAGLFQAFNQFLTHVHLHWLIYVIFGMMFLGFMGVIANYLAATSQGLLVLAKDHFLPKGLIAFNRYKVPHRIIIMQGVLTLLIALLFVSKTVRSAYWQIEAIIGVGVSLRYAIFFIGGLVMKYRFTQPQRDLQVPGGKIGMWIVCVAGIAICIFAGTMTFIPRDKYAGNLLSFEALLIIGTLLSIIIPYLIGEYSLYKARCRGDLSRDEKG